MKTEELPLITVITVVFNDVKHIEETMLSVVNQTYPNIEYIIIDGGSTDGTVDIIKKYADRITYWVSEPDNGIYDAMNKGIRKATGEWCCFINAGDVFVHENIVRSIFERGGCTYDVIYGDTIHIFTSGRFLHKAEDVKVLKKRMPFCHQSCFVKSLLLKQYEFDCQYKVAADYDLFYRLYKQHAYFLKINKVIAVFDGIEGISSSHPELLFQEYSRINGKNMFWFISTVRICNWLKTLLRFLPQNVQMIILRKFKQVYTSYKSID
ncbi:glycosyltransferase [Phocaeicola coprophilus]|nr:glycosyltransferase [Phocaeicola coprophilus]